jgi:hypothetical protein
LNPELRRFTCDAERLDFQREIQPASGELIPEKLFRTDCVIAWTYSQFVANGNTGVIGIA